MTMRRTLLDREQDPEGSPAGTTSVELTHILHDDGEWALEAWQVARYGAPRLTPEGVATRRRGCRVLVDEESAREAWLGETRREPGSLRPAGARRG